MMGLLRYFTGRNKREDRKMRALLYEVQLNAHVTTTATRHYFILEVKFILVAIFIALMDLLFCCIFYVYLFIAFRGNMRNAYLNPDARRMLWE